ncbi:MAG: hypothetical protein IJ766_04890 [Clostridia bacterium]|nr:hypothetical protein [Clostridia bacterium]
MYNTGNPVKDRFLPIYSAICEEKGLSLKEIRKEIKNATGVDIKKTTAGESIDSAKHNLNADFVIAFCFTYKIDINEIYFQKKIPDKEYLSPSATVFKHSSDFHVLNDKKFFGTYYGYFFSTQYIGEIDSFILTVDETKAIFRLRTHVKDRETHSLIIDERIFEGKPMHLEPHLIYIMFQQDTGDAMYTLAYNWFDINTGKHLFFRQGALLTQYRGETRYPQIQSFIFMDREISDENLSYVAGQLKLCSDAKSNYIFIKKTVFDALFMSEAHHNVTSGIERLEYSEKKHECLWFEEDSIRIDLRNEGYDAAEIERIICKLKAVSLNPNAIVFYNNKDNAQFLLSLGKNQNDSQ